MKTTSPSELNKRITLQAPTTAKDALGTPVTTWVDVATVWAKKTTHRSDEAVQAMAQTGISIHNFRIRWRADVRSSWRVKHGNVQMAIVGKPIEVNEPSGRYLDITAKEAA